MSFPNPKSLTVLIAARGDGAPSARALSSLRGQPVQPLVLYPECEPDSAPASTDAVAVPADSFAALRAEGLRRTDSSVVAVLSQDYTVEPCWAAEALKPEYAEVVCGEVHPPSSGWAARAAYLWEYAHLAPPCRPGALSAAEARLVPAGAVVYRGGALDPQRLREHPSELDYHARMAEAGLRFVRNPRLRVVYHPPEPLSRFRADRRRWSADDAAARYGSRPLFVRLLLAASRVLLPPLLTLRFAHAVAPKPQYWARAIASAPLLILFALDQMIGEIRGLLSGGES